MVLKKWKYPALSVVIAIALTGIVLTLAAPVWAGAEFLKKHPTPSRDSADYVEGSVLIKLKKGAAIRALRGIIHGLPVRGKAVSPDNFKKFKNISAKTGKECLLFRSPTHTTQELIEHFRKSPEVKTVEPDYIMRVNQVFPDDEYFDQVWGLHNTGQEVNGVTGAQDADIDAPEAWERSTGSSDVIAAVLDTGVDYSHPDLSDNMWINQAELEGDPGVDDDENGYVDDIYGIDAYNENSDPYDDNRHGTHVAGIISGRGNNDLGVVGVTWNTRIMALKFLSGSGSGPTSAAIESIEYVIAMNERPENNIVAINASWGSSSDSELLNDAISAAADAGIVFVAACGNSASDNDGGKKLYPAAADLPSIISVAATDQSDLLADFSSFGAVSTDLGAPGVNILSAIPGGGYTPESGDFFFDDMEEGDDKWDMVVTDPAWAITEEKPYEDSHAWSDSPDGNYQPSDNKALVSTTLDLSAQTDSLMLGFWLFKDLDPTASGCGKKDTLYVEISDDDGANWMPLGQLYGNDPAWKLYSYSIPETCRTDTFRFRFRLEARGCSSGNYDGVYIDNVGIGEGTGVGAYEYLRGTSMAAPHVTGAVALIADLHPDDDLYHRIDRILSGAEVIDSLKGKASKDGRLNLSNSADPELVLHPYVVGTDVAEDERTITLTGICFGNSQGKVVFEELLYNDPMPREGAVISWTENEIVVEKPEYSGRYLYVIPDNGLRSNRKSHKLSMWEDGAENFIARSSGASVVLNGKIYYLGGYQGGSAAMSSFEIYDPALSEWSFQAGCYMKEVRAHHAVAATGGKAYLFGGYNDGTELTLASAEVYDPVVHSFSYIHELPENLCFHHAAAAGGKIYVTGGLTMKYDEFGEPYDEVRDTLYRYDPDTDNWDSLENMSALRFAHGSVALNGKIYVFGGISGDAESAWSPKSYLSSAEVFDPSTGAWTPIADMPVPLARMGAVTDGRYIYAVAGTEGRFEDTSDSFWYGGGDMVLRYDPRADLWQALPERNLKRPNVANSAAFLEGYGLYRTGGYGHYEERRRGALKVMEYLALDLILDADGDAIPDADDNCRLTYNPGQQDTDADSYGNICDCDLDNDDVVGPSDFAQFRLAWLSSPGDPEWNPDADFDTNAAVGPSDFGIFRVRWLTSAPFE